MSKRTMCVVITLVLFFLSGGVVRGQNASSAPAAAAAVEQFPPPSLDCIPTGEPNSWYCHGVPDPAAQAAAEEEGFSVDDIGRIQYPELYTEVDKLPPLPDRVTLGRMSKKEVQKLIKSRNPRAVFDANGVPIEEISKILDRHADELAQICGVRGWGPNKDGIIVDVTEPHCDVPAELEGVPVHVAPIADMAIQDAGSHTVRSNAR